MDESALAETLSGYLKEDFELVKKSSPNYATKRARRKKQQKGVKSHILPKIHRRGGPKITFKSAKKNVKKASNSWYHQESPILNGKVPVRAKYIRPRWKTRRNRAYKYLKSLVEEDEIEEMEKVSSRKKRMAAQLRIKGGNVSKKGTWPCKY